MPPRCPCCFYHLIMNNSSGNFTRETVCGKFTQAYTKDDIQQKNIMPWHITQHNIFRLTNNETFCHEPLQIRLITDSMSHKKPSILNNLIQYLLVGWHVLWMGSTITKKKKRKKKKWLLNLAVYFYRFLIWPMRGKIGELTVKAE